MKENAILIRLLDIQKIFLDFSSMDNVYKPLNAERVSTIHTKETQDLSSQLGIHLMGFINRDGDDINNEKACEISGYDFIGGFLLLCKTDDKFNALPFTEKELECVYTYLTEGKIIACTSIDEADAFFNEYGINNPIPDFGVEPEIYRRKDVPYILLIRYDLSKLNDKQATIFGQKLFNYSEIILNNFQLVEKEVYSDGKCYIKNFKEDSFYNILIQAKDNEKEEDIILIFDAKNVINKGFLQEKEEIKPYSGPMYTCPPEEAFDELDQMDEDDEEEEEFFMISKKKKQEGPFGRDPLDDVKGKPPVDYKIPDPLDDVKTLENLKHTNVGKEEKNMHAIRIKTRKAPENYDQGASIMLGSPVLPKGMQDEIPSTAMFLMQIRLEDIKDLDEENLLPHKGYLYFFLDTEDGVYDLKPIVKYSEKQPEEYIGDWNEIVEGFEQFNEPFLIEFEKCDESDDGNKLLGCPGDWQFSETPNRLLFQLDPMGDEELGLFPTFDGYMYFFFADNPRDFDNVKFVEDFS